MSKETKPSPDTYQERVEREAELKFYDWLDTKQGRELLDDQRGGPPRTANIFGRNATNLFTCFLAGMLAGLETTVATLKECEAEHGTTQHNTNAGIGSGNRSAATIPPPESRN